VKVVQAPNPPIIIALVAAIPSLIWPDSFIGQLCRVVTSAALLYWAYLELFDGINWFRRALGAVVMVAVLMGIIMWVVTGQ
jgi:hypothetical protein